MNTHLLVKSKKIGQRKKTGLSRIWSTLSLLSMAMVMSPSAQAMSFDAEPVDLDDFAIVASQLPTGSHTINILEQLESQRQCWLEKGSHPTKIDPLLLRFNFVRDCKRYDSNGFSVQMSNQQFGYQLRVRESRQDLVLEAFNPFDREAPVFEVGRAHGVTKQHTKIHLNSGWSLNRRQWQGRPIGHIEVSFQGVNIGPEPITRAD